MQIGHTEQMADSFPVLRSVVLDTTDARSTAEFYRQLLGYSYRSGDENPEDGQPDPRDKDWLVLVDQSGQPCMSFQQVEELAVTTWPDAAVPMQLHIDFTVSDANELAQHYKRAISLGATLLLDRTDDPHEPLYVLAGPAGHPFCLFVG
jgi:catechol 2,3-dioxygenase-like lactoylglutathione lyase family enzyme